MVVQVSQSIRYIKRHLQQLHIAQFRHQSVTDVKAQCVSVSECHDKVGGSYLRIRHAFGGNETLLVAMQVVE